MNVDRLNQNQASGAYGRRAGRAGDAERAGDAAAAAGGSAAGGAGAADGLQLSGEARLVQRAEAAVRAAPDVREQLVGELRQRIQSGNYEVDDAALAQKILEENS